MTADTNIHTYEPRLGHGLPHDPFNAIVGPRPIGWIGTHDGAGHRNLAPYSFFNAFNYVPPIVGFASIGAKDTLRNAQATGEFTWNLVTRELAERMNASCAAVPPEVDEFALAGLTPLASQQVGAPRVAESPVSFECRVTQILQLQTAAGDTVPTWLVLGEVVAVHITRQLLVDGVYDTAAAPSGAAWRRPGGLLRDQRGAALPDASPALRSTRATPSPGATPPHRATHARPGAAPVWRTAPPAPPRPPARRALQAR